jgi:hypothetical protein
MRGAVTSLPHTPSRSSVYLITGCVFTAWYLAKHHVRWVTFHHGMACPQVADGGEVLQIWRVAANILNKQSWTAEKG